MAISISRRCRRAALLVCLGLVLAGSVLACQVPVFRYALERWDSDRYRVIILSEGVVENTVKEQLLPLTGTPGSPGHANVRVHDVATDQDPFVRQLWKRYGSGSKTLMVTLYPEESSIAPDEVACVTELSALHVAQVLDSPTRNEIIHRLAAGQSAVWVLLESGNAAKDQAALKTLNTQLASDAVWLKLPSPEEMEIKPDLLASTKIQLRIEFSVISLNRDDPQEKFLVDCLLNSESDLRDFDEPLAFPVFGRGRVLYALVGQGIAADTIRKASAFIVGPCSCQVKEQNPGFDLLLNCNWSELVGDVFISDPIPGSGAQPKLLAIPPGRSK